MIQEAELLTKVLTEHGYCAKYRPRLKKIDIAWSEWDTQGQVVVRNTKRIAVKRELVERFINDR